MEMSSSGSRPPYQSASAITFPPVRRPALIACARQDSEHYTGLAQSRAFRGGAGSGGRLRRHRALDHAQGLLAVPAVAGAGLLQGQGPDVAVGDAEGGKLRRALDARRPELRLQLDRDVVAALDDAVQPRWIDRLGGIHAAVLVDERLVPRLMAVVVRRAGLVAERAAVGEDRRLPAVAAQEQAVGAHAATLDAAADPPEGAPP